MFQQCLADSWRKFRNQNLGIEAIGLANGKFVRKPEINFGAELYSNLNKKSFI